MKYLFYTLAIIMVLLIIFFSLYTIPPYFKLPKQKSTKIFGSVVTIDDAVKYLRDSKKTDWELVKAAQNLVSQKMEYSRRNNWDTPERAFIRGMGYCQQQTDALFIILKKLGINSRVVMSLKCKFPSGKIHEYISPPIISGHAWLKVKIDNEEKDVCPGDINNEPGKINFEILDEIRNYSGIPKILGHIGSSIVNVYRDNKALKELKNFNRKM